MEYIKKGDGVIQSEPVTINRYTIDVVLICRHDSLLSMV